MDWNLKSWKTGCMFFNQRKGWTSYVYIYLYLCISTFIYVHFNNQLTHVKKEVWHHDVPGNAAEDTTTLVTLVYPCCWAWKAPCPSGGPEAKAWLSFHGFHPTLGGGNSNIFGIFTPTWGNDSHFDEHIFQMGWNHQLENMLGPFKQIPNGWWKGCLENVASIPSSQHIHQHSLEDATHWPLSRHLKQIQVLCGFSKILFGEFQAARMKKLQPKNNGWNQIPIVATSILCRRLLLIATKSFN